MLAAGNGGNGAAWTSKARSPVANARELPRGITSETRLLFSCLRVFFFLSRLDLGEAERRTSTATVRDLNAEWYRTDQEFNWRRYR